jgi:CRP/FNR family cyclic AMP-dependent transcriptional regulator
MKTTDPMIQRLRQIALFSVCSARELALISARVTAHHARAGDILTREGHVGHEFVVIVDGTATVHAGDRTIAVLGPGDFFGEIALLDNGPRTATVIADTDLVAEVSSHREFVDLLAEAPSLARNLLIGLARRLRATDLQLTA